MKNDIFAILSKTGLKKAGAAFALLLVATITISCSHSENDDDLGTSGMLGEVSWKYNESTKTLIFSGEGSLELSIEVRDYLKKLDFDKVVIKEGITSIGDNAFSYFRFMTSVTIPNSVTSIGKRAFGDCSRLTSITIPNSVTSIGANAFQGCDGLSSVTIPNSVTSIGDWAFSGCNCLISVTIPNSVTSIEFCAFYKCSGLTSVNIPNSVTRIGGDAFYGCSSLTEVYSLIKEPFYVDDSVFEGLPANATLYVPMGTKAKYEKRGWKGFKNIVERYY